MVWRFDLSDFSHHNFDPGGFDWDVYAATAPGNGAVTKMSQRHNYADPTGPTARAQMARLGLRRRGLYHWQSPTSEASIKDQFAHIKRTFGQFAQGEFFMLDAEQSTITEPESFDLLQRVEGELTGRPSAHYGGISTAGGVSWRSDRIRMSAFGPRCMWLAAYLTQERLAARLKQLHVDHLVAHVNQYSSDGTMPNGAHVPFSPARTDMNQVNDFAVLDACCGYSSNVIVIEEDEMHIVRNSEARTFEGQGPFSAGVLKYAYDDRIGTVRHLEEIDLKAAGIVNSPTLGEPMTNAELDQLEARTVPATGGGAPIVFPDYEFTGKAVKS